MSMDSRSGVHIAVNMSRVLNSEQSFELMRAIGPKVCVLTASSPGFVGFQAQYQTGVLPMAGRYGGGKLHMERELNPIRNYQYTVWRDLADHQEFHRESFARVFELCVHCLSMVVEGPWEPIYAVAAAKMPPVEAIDRTVAITEHAVKLGQEGAFEQGMTSMLEAISASPGFLGYMVLREVGVSAFGSFMLDPISSGQMLETLGANPPPDPKPLFEPEQARPTPAEYLIHTEWASAEAAQLGLERPLDNRRIRRIHEEHVLPHVIRGPYTMLFRTMFEDPSFRPLLVG